MGCKVPQEIAAVIIGILAQRTSDSGHQDGLPPRAQRAGSTNVHCNAASILRRYGVSDLPGSTANVSLCRVSRSARELTKIVHKLRFCRCSLYAQRTSEATQSTVPHRRRVLEPIRVTRAMVQADTRHLATKWQSSVAAFFSEYIPSSAALHEQPSGHRYPSAPKAIVLRPNDWSKTRVILPSADWRANSTRTSGPSANH